MEDSWFIIVLLNGLYRRRTQPRIARYPPQRLNVAVGTDDSAQFHASLAVDLSRQRRISGLDTAEQHAGLKLSLVDDLRSRWRSRLHFWRTRPLLLATALNAPIKTSFAPCRPTPL